ncbi:acyl carrier protein, mitochondrial-like isoform X2 [Artemia franciscana]|uniref:Acyl carrier protein n=1 Tax=Artemia franciscana TaxID=6661 RepID=A8D864_ARTSF|nr:mitochondrial acyl carrier protein [Artemia franciscana]KAK2714343.1 hypothetical protein QYM36_008792 [Artemia franciscana]
MRALSKTLRFVSATAPNLVSKAAPKVLATGFQHCLLSQLASVQNQLTCCQVKTQVSLRKYGGGPPLSLKLIEERVFLVLRLYDKVDPSKLTLESHFMNDLGLDSLDHVEVIMAMEDEFGFEIPDADAERLLRPADIVRYVGDHEDVYE